MIRWRNVNSLFADASDDSLTAVYLLNLLLGDDGSVIFCLSHIESQTRSMRYWEDQCCVSGFSQFHFFTDSKTMCYVCCWFTQRETALFVREHLLSVALTFKIIRASSGSGTCWSATTFCWAERVCKHGADLLVWSSKPFSSFCHIFYVFNVLTKHHVAMLAKPKDTSCDLWAQLCFQSSCWIYLLK